MYLIALCDDEEADLDKTEQMLRIYESVHPDIEFVIKRFQSADHLIDCVRQNEYAPDCILMDIYMPEKLGIEAARRKYLLLRIEGRIQRILVNEIVYCEAQGKAQYLHLSDGTQYNLRRTMAEIYEMLAGYREFVRVGVAYIVNLEHIESLSTQEVQMDNCKKIFLPRGSYHPLRERYFSYYCENE